MLTRVSDSDNIFVFSAKNGYLHEGTLVEYLDSVRHRHGKADFNIISLIRLMYSIEVSKDIKETVFAVLCDYPFWY